MDKHINRSLDEDLKNIPELRWLPWIGKNCIFVGVEASNLFNEAMDELRIEHNSVQWHSNPVSRTYPRISEIKIDTCRVKILFMQHSSQMFSWSHLGGFHLRT